MGANSGNSDICILFSSRKVGVKMSGSRQSFLTAKRRTAHSIVLVTKSTLKEPIKDIAGDCRAFSRQVKAFESLHTFENKEIKR